MTEWWRSWHGAPTDSKWLAIARRAEVAPFVVSAVAWVLFDHASQQDDRGDITTFDVESYAVWSGLPEDDVRRVIDAMTTKGIIAEGRLTAWERRQPKREDDSTERVRAFRERQRDMKRSVTHGNSRTEQSRAETEQNRTEETQADAPGASARSQVTDPLFEVVVEVCYHRPVSEITDDERGRVNKAVAQLRKLGATAEQVRIREAEYHIRSPDYPFTPQTLTKYWTDLGQPRASPNGIRPRAGPRQFDPGTPMNRSAAERSRTGREERAP